MYASFTLISCVLAGLFGYWLRNLVEIVRSIKDNLLRPKETEHKEVEFAEPLTASQIAAREQREDLERLNPGIRINQ